MILCRLSFSLVCCSLVSINGAEGNFRAYKEALEGETMIPEYDTLVTAADMPGLVRWLARKVIDERRAHLLSCTRKLASIACVLRSFLV